MHLGRPTVLVVDDDSETRLEFSSWLTDAGYRCLTADNTSTALWYARQLAPDAAVVDVGRRHERLRLAAALGSDLSMGGVVLTSPSGTRRALPALPTGVCCHLTKPAGQTALVAAVARATVSHHEAKVAAARHRCAVGAALTAREQRLGDLLVHASSASAAHHALRRSFGGRVPLLLAHAERVADHASTLAEMLMLPAAQIIDVRGAALLHDIGKLALPEAVLFGEQPLSDAETEALGNHHARTMALLNRAPALASVTALVELVHARWDGSGLPWGLAGEQIPAGARIIAVADALDSPVGEGKGRSRLEVVQAALTRHAGSRLDPDLVRVCLGALDGTPESATLTLRRAVN